MRALITDDLSPACLTLLRDGGVEPVVRLGASPDELKALAADADAWLIRSGTTLTADLLAAAPKLRVVARAGVGVDNVDLAAATRRGVLVVNAPDGNTVSTAEHTCALLLALVRRIPQAAASLAAGRWERKPFTGAELDGKTLGVVGLGRVGRGVAERMRGFGMRVLAFDPVVAPEAAERAGIELAPLERLWAEADVLTFHTPLTDATRGLLDAAALARCKDGVYVVNAARGGIVDEAALLDALDAGKVAGAALDVFSAEPPPPGLAALLAHPRVVATPHIAASTAEAQEKVAVQVAEDVVRVLRGAPARHPVNGAGLGRAAEPEAAPYLALAERLGHLAAQLADGPVRAVTVATAGDAADAYAEPVARAALVGVLGPWSDVPVNLINVDVLAREHGLRVERHRQPAADDYANAVEVAVETEGGARALRGAVLGTGRAADGRLVGLDGFRFEVRPEGHLLFYQNEDRPGMLAAVGARLAGGGINIAGLALGREAPGGTALSVLTTDEPIPPGLRAAIAALDGVRDVRAVSL
jgi:D-3-phosphoglycerate dehydrogenase